MHYTAKFEADGEAILVTFPALPEAITGGDTEAEAHANAQDALELVLLTYVKDGRALPLDRRPRGPGIFRRIVASAQVAAKIAFIQAFKASDMTRVALAAKLGKVESEVRRMLDPYHRTKLGAIEEGLAALGKRLVVSVEDIAA